jgi:hypothetical protein
MVGEKLLGQLSLYLYINLELTVPLFLLAHARSYSLGFMLA